MDSDGGNVAASNNSIGRREVEFNLERVQGTSVHDHDHLRVKFVDRQQLIALSLVRNAQARSRCREEDIVALTPYAPWSAWNDTVCGDLPRRVL